MRFVTARATPKVCLGLAVLFCYVPALGAFPAGVTWVNSNQRNAGHHGFVCQEQSQLRECPGMQNGTLLAPGLNPFADAVQFLDGNTAIGAFSFRNDLLADIVINPRSKASLFSGEQLQSSLGCTGLLLLQFRPQAAVPVADRFDLRPGMPFAIGVAGDVANSEIDAQEFGRLNPRWVGQVYLCSTDRTSLCDRPDRLAP